MRLWKRSNTELDVAREAFTAAVSVRGDLACGDPACGRHDAASCSYMDNRGHSCGVSACADHGDLIDGRSYCGLHAATVQAVGVADADGHMHSRVLPEVDNRAPSLVSWVARDLHDRVVELLAGNLNAEEGERLLIDEMVTPARGSDGARRWEQAWKIVSNAGISVKVAVLVEERAPTVVMVRVDREVVACGAPPWVTGAGRRGDQLSSADAAAQRRAFYEPIHERVAAAVVAERSAGVRGPY